jgi:hypothetical protein
VTAKRRMTRAGVVMAAALVLAACASLASLIGVEPPVFAIAQGRQSVLSLDPASILTARPSARLRLWTQVRNPNSIGFTLSTLRGTVFLEGSEVARYDLPLGLPLRAAQDTVIPLDITFGLPALSSLGRLGQALLEGRAVQYRLDGTLGVDAGALGQPTFGPRTWLQGSVDVRAALLGSPRE